jgi:hypothetical protein
MSGGSGNLVELSTVLSSLCKAGIYVKSLDSLLSNPLEFTKKSLKMRVAGPEDLSALVQIELKCWSSELQASEDRIRRRRIMSAVLDLLSSVSCTHSESLLYQICYRMSSKRMTAWGMMVRVRMSRG